MQPYRRTTNQLTTHDTQKIYTWIDRQPQGEIPQLYELSVEFQSISPSTGYPVYGKSHACNLLVEKETLAKCGIGLTMQQRKENPPKRTVDDVVLELLEKVGVFPQ